MDLHVGSPTVRGPLTVFPVWDGEAVPTPEYDVGAGSLVVGECPQGAVVGRLQVHNPGPRPALLLEGEILVGGRQDRAVRRPALVGAATSAPVAVWCVEQGRWGGSTGHARSARRAPVRVRAAADQHEVWSRVAGYGASPTGSLVAGSRARDTAARELVAGLVPRSSQTGVLLGVGGRPLLLETFDAPSTLAAVWDELLAGVAVDAVGAPPVETPGRRARRFVRGTDDLASRAAERTPQGGEARETRDDRTALTVLGYGGRRVVTVAVNRRHPLLAAA